MRPKGPLDQIFNTVESLARHTDIFHHCIITGSASIASYRDEQKQEEFLKELKEGKHDVDTLFITEKFPPKNMFNSKDSIPPQKIISSFNNGKIGIAATKMIIDGSLYGLQFIYPSYFKYLFSLKKRCLPYYRQFPLNEHRKTHHGFTNSREYLYPKSGLKGRVLIEFRHNPIVNSRYYLNDYQSILLHGQDILRPEKYGALRKNLVKRICERARKENCFSINHMMNIFSYNKHIWPKKYEKKIEQEITQLLK